MQMVVTTISHNVYKCMLQKTNLSDILSTLSNELAHDVD